MVYAACISVFLAVAAWHLLLLHLSPILGLSKPNFRQEIIPASYGIIMLAYALAGLDIIAILNPSANNHILVTAVVASSMCLLGFIDDVFGSRETSGFRGHFRMLIQQGKLTTGAAKAIGGGLTGIAAGYVISDGSTARWIVSALLIPLGANTLNLLDLRPGRACGAMILGLAMVFPFAFYKHDLSIVFLITCITFAFAFWDGRGKAMMGDSGSNQLGAVLGVLIAVQTHISFQIVMLLLMIGIQIYSEKHSINALIDRNRLLRKIDSRLGVR